MVPSVRARMPVEKLASTTPAAAEDGALEGGGLVGVGEGVSALGDAFEGRVRSLGGDAVAQEASPVIGDDLIEGGDELVEVVGHDFGRGVASFAEEEHAEIVEALFAAGELADGGIDVEPDEGAFLVVVLAATPVAPLAAGAAQDGGGDGGVLEIAPSAAGLYVEDWRRRGQSFAEFLGVVKPLRTARISPRYCVMPS